MTAQAFYSFAGQQIKDIVSPYGFKKKGRFFYRITEDGVVQQFCLLWLYRDFTIRFEMASVYGECDLKTEGAEISQLIDGSFNGWLTGFPFESRFDPEDNPIDYAADVCVQAVKSTLLPFWEAHKDHRSAHAFVSRHSSPVAWGGDKYDARELGFFLGMGDMTSAMDYLLYRIENADKYNKYWWNMVKEKYHQLLDAICLEDQEAISQYMDEKKKATYAEYKWKK